MKRFILAAATVALALGAAQAAPVTLNAAVGSWLDPNSPNTNAELRTLIQDFQKSHPDIQIRWDALGYDELQKKLLTTAAAGNPPDFAYVDSVWVQQLAALGALQPLDNLWPAADRNDYLTPFLEGAKYDGKLYAVWDSTDTRVLWYNQKAFQDAGIAAPPKNWTEFLNDAKKLTKNNQYGIGVALGQHEYLVADVMLPMFWGLGGDLVDDKGKPVFDTGANRAAMIKVLDFLNQLKTSNVVAPDALTQQGENALYPGMVSGRYAMVIGNANLLDANLKKLMPNAESVWKPAVLPAPTGGKSSSDNGGFTWAIMTKDPAKQKAAWEFISYWNSPKVQLARNKATDSVAVRKSVAADAFYKSAFWNTVNQAAASGRTRPGTAIYPTISQQLQLAAQNVLTGKMTAAQAVDQAGKAVTTEYNRQQTR